MLRRIYYCVLYLHPPGFRMRFGEEMLSIFDHTKGRLSAFRLLMDSILSLTRQWTLRPEFRNDVLAAPAREIALDGPPSFSTLDPFRPSATAVIHGVVLTATLFSVTCFAIRYSWIHVLQVHIPAIEFETLPAIHPSANQAEFRGAPSLKAVKEASSYLSQPASVPAHLYVEPLPVEPENNAAPSDAPELRSKVVSATPTLPVLVPATVDISLKSYAGIYTSDLPRLTISIVIREENLVMHVNSQPARSLSPLSKTTFAVEGEGDARVEFASVRGGKFHRIHLSQPCTEITAHRQ